MPPRGVTNPRRKRQYEHIKDSEEQRGVGDERAEEIAARTVNKQRAQAGETKSARGGRKSGGRKSKASTRAGGSRKAAAGRTSSGRASSGSRAASAARSGSKKAGRKTAGRKASRKAG